MKRFYSFAFVFVSTLFSAYAADVSALIAVSADGSETKYELSKVQTVTFEQSQATPSMVVNQKDETSVAGYSCIKFGSMPMEVQEASGETVFVYPNPVVNFIQISGIDVATAVEVVNLSGVTLIKTSEQKIDVSNLSAGVYLLKVNGQTVKFVKK